MFSPKKLSTLRIIASQNCWSRDPRPLLCTSKRLYRRVRAAAAFCWSESLQGCQPLQDGDVCGEVVEVSGVDISHTLHV